MPEVGPILKLSRGPAEFSIRLSRRALILSWRAETEAPNVGWVTVLTLKIGWPPLHWVRGFIDWNEVADD